MPNPQISVVIPVYNVEKYIDRCVGSILRQTYENIELILVATPNDVHCSIAVAAITC